jgi:hypothetical protein|nr:MAG TPA: hypothetical protein [Caudoviricetes sp.]
MKETKKEPGCSNWKKEDHIICADLTQLGEDIDKLQQSNYNGVPLSEICSDIKALEAKFLDKSEWIDDSNNQIVFFYTKANYMAVLIEILQHYGKSILSCEPYAQFSSARELIYEYSLQRISLYRKALSVYDHQSEPKISQMWMNQVRVNLANLYTEIGRTVEALEILEPIKNSFGMARINYASKLHQMSSHTLDKSEQKEFLLHALYYYESTIENYPERKKYDPIPDDVFQGLHSAYTIIKQELDSSYADVNIYSDIPDDWANDIANDLNIGNSGYKKWCRDKRLVLSFRNLFQNCSTSDDIHLPNMGISYFAKDKTLSYYSWYNTLKQEYNQARYNLYCVENFDELDVHESQEYILLINTLDYPAIGYRTELLKSAMREAYGVLDKIGLLCNDFVRGKNMPVRKISFINWFQGIEKEIRIYDSFTPLYWVARDISKDGAFANLRKMRNVIEHRYLRVVDHSKISLEEALSDDDKMEYTVSFSDLRKQTYSILRLIRALLFYVVIAFNSCYLEAMETSKRENKIFIPLSLDFYDDEWKN